MRRIRSVLSALAVAAVCGCGEQGTPGGPGATDPRSSPPAVGNADGTFTLSTPMTSTSIKQGESKDVAIGIRRGDNFSSDVTVEFGQMPQGLSFEPATGVLRSNDSEIKFLLKAAEDAAVGDFTIPITGRPVSGPAATNEIKVSVAGR